MNANDDDDHQQHTDAPARPLELRKDGAVSRMRSHKGNAPVLPQTKLCPHCPARFTRTTHLNRHLRTHTNERMHRCETCNSQFTRSDLLARHKRSCGDAGHASRTRRKSCKACAESKVKCDLQQPCAKCRARGRDCVFLTTAPAAAAFDTSPPSTFQVNIDARSPAADPALHMPPAYLPAAAAAAAGYDTAMADLALGKMDSIFSGFSGLDLGGGPSLQQPAPGDAASNPAESVASDALPVHSHLSARYSNDMFEPLFSTLFSTAEAALAGGPDEFMWVEGMGAQSESPPDNYGFPFATQEVEERQGMEESFLRSMGEPSMFAPQSSPPPVAPSKQDPGAAPEDVGEPPAAELQHYLYLFLSAFLAQMPIVHAPTFSVEGKPPVLIGAMQACGALFVKTRTANAFVKRKLTQAREVLMQEFARNPTDTNEQINLILAVALLQTIGLFHQKAHQRASSNMYHGMLVMMIRRSGLIEKSASWQVPNLSEASLEDAWRDWSKHEMTKRSLLWSYLHDCCHAIYFALPPSYQPSELRFHLPCEEALWAARSAGEWLFVLRGSSAYGADAVRLAGVPMMRAVSAITSARLLAAPTALRLSPFAHFVTIHAVLCDFCVRCVVKAGAGGEGEGEGAEEEERERTVMGMQYALHNWLQTWLSSPDVPKTDGRGEEPPFIANALPFYWLGQASLLVYQENVPPFEPGVDGGASDAKIEKRFRLAKQWLKHIRAFLRGGDAESTLFWDELMKIRLEGVPDDQEGVLGFFPDPRG